MPKFIINITVALLFPSTLPEPHWSSIAFGRSGCSGPFLDFVYLLEKKTFNSKAKISGFFRHKIIVFDQSYGI